MKDNFDDIKDIWHSGDRQAPDIETVKKEILVIRKQKKDQMIRWYLWMGGFSFFIISYVIYTDELNSMYKSVSEFILLFTGSFLLYNSWKSIRYHQKEYLLNGHEFLNKIRDERIKSGNKRIIISCISSTSFTIAIFLYFFEILLTSEKWFLISAVSLVIINMVIWLMIRPLYEKKNMRNSTAFINTIERLLQDIK
ncbi:hypothetical protein P2W68_04695 [Chryseobacterium arthrosphaerae]|uniref:hypothetical protein n=1 Tax=Chryseobacterium arthrosphaerae TaxID=651561 RepID=UPI0023E31239|nr:hypothetical protein [Chryseobacterium arthrosphaerae]WES98912.1 hypothetical protein P2W68_04695 [Chryseobacterium arthrosphaerae]